MLSVHNLQAGYGASQVLFDISLEIREGEVVTLMGRNGMGKTTTVRSIMGLLTPQGGRVEYDGRSIGGLAPEKVARLGFGLVPEGRQVFPNLTVRENLVATSANRLGAPTPWTLVSRRNQSRSDASENPSRRMSFSLTCNSVWTVQASPTSPSAASVRLEQWTR